MSKGVPLARSGAGKGRPGSSNPGADADNEAGSWSFKADVTNDPILRQAFLRRPCRVVDDG
jgi:hypothetical protein